jgi:uncharacterized damage-inducible protein DinB
MDELTRIGDQMKRAWEGEAWHGPGLEEVIADVAAREAVARPLPDAHTIWEIVLHLTTWVDITRRRVEGEDVGTVTDAEDWPAVIGTGSEDWEAARRSLAKVQDRLIETISALNPKYLEARPPGASSSRYVILHGTIQHNLYHAGQIAMLKRAVRRTC